MSDDKNLDDIILFPSGVSELREVMRDADVKIASPNLIRFHPKAVVGDGVFIITYHLHHLSIDDMEGDFRKLIAEQGFSGVVHYALLTTLVTKVNDVECPPTISHGSQGLPITIKPRSYRG